MNEDDLELETVNHRAPVSWAYAVIAFALIAFVFWLTATPKRWLWVAALVAIACGLGLYACLR